jgi:hypothetical protein
VSVVIVTLLVTRFTSHGGRRPLRHRYGKRHGRTGWASLLQVGRLDPEAIIFTTTAP